MTPYLFQHSRTLKTEGIALLLLGLLAMMLPVFFTMVIEFFLGIVLLLAGIGTAIRALQLKGFPGSAVSLLGGILSAVVGLLFLLNPLEGVVTLTLLLALLFLFQGAAEVYMALQHRQWTRWGWMLWSGIASIALAAILLFGLPGTATWGIGVLVGIHLLFSGSWLWQLGNEIQKSVKE